MGINAKLNKDKAILAVVAGGFLMTAIEVRYLHREVVRETAVAWIPTIASAAAMFGAGMCLLPKRAVQISGMGLLGLVAVSGLVGFGFHTELKPKAVLKMFEPSPIVADARSSGEEGESDDSFEGFDKQAEKEEKESGAPALAPLSVTGLALIGLIGASGRSAGREA